MLLVQVTDYIMKLQKSTIEELGIILNEEFGTELSPMDLERFAYSLVGYFGLLLKAKVREGKTEGFGNRSASRIDKSIQKKQDREVKL